MKRFRPAFVFALILVAASLGADVFTAPENIEFGIVVNKTGISQLYFAAPGSWNVPKTDSNPFPLVSGVPQPVTIDDIGVFWSLFPDSESASESVAVDIKLLATSVSEYVQDVDDDYMLDLQTDSSSGVPVGLNYSIEAYDVGENGSKGNLVDSLVISVDEITTRLNREKRMLSLFNGTVTASGVPGKRLVKLTLSPPTTDEGKYYMEGDYRGYLILHVETY